MIRPRIIPILCLNSDGELISTISFNKTTYIGDPLNAIAVYNNFSVDELGFLDIYASRQGRPFNLEVLKNISNECKTPLFAGGGVNTLNHIEEILKNGAEKVVISSAIVGNPKFLEKATMEFGTSSIIVCLDCIRLPNKRYQVMNTSRNEVTDCEINSFISQLQSYGLGECIVQSVQQDGQMSGYDSGLLEAALAGTAIPIIALGGRCFFDKNKNLSKLYNICALASGSTFAFYDDQREVLINYPNVSMLRSLIAQ